MYTGTNQVLDLRGISIRVLEQLACRNDTRYFLSCEGAGPPDYPHGISPYQCIVAKYLGESLTKSVRFHIIIRKQLYNLWSSSPNCKCGAVCVEYSTHSCGYYSSCSFTTAIHHPTSSNILNVGLAWQLIVQCTKAFA